MKLKNRSLISIRDLTRDEIDYVLHRAHLLEGMPREEKLRGKVLGSMFFEPSTRTMLSFDTAMKRLGGNVIGFSGTEATSIQKGESISDTVRMIESYADVIVMRHPQEGIAEEVSNVAKKPIINAGDGKNQHPTQTLVDLYAIRKTQGRIDGLTIAIVGDLRHGRAVNSLLDGLAYYDVKVLLVAPPSLQLSEEQEARVREHGLDFTMREKLEDVLDEADVLYMTRVQKERFKSIDEYERVKDHYILTADMLRDAKENLRVLHPLPRVCEITEDVDQTSHAYYFQQAAHAVAVRMALLNLLLT